MGQSVMIKLSSSHTRFLPFNLKNHLHMLQVVVLVPFLKGGFLQRRKLGSVYLLKYKIGDISQHEDNDAVKK